MLDPPYEVASSSPLLTFSKFLFENHGWRTVGED